MQNKYLLANELVGIVWPLILKSNFIQTRQVHLFRSLINYNKFILASDEKINFNASVAVVDDGVFQRFTSKDLIPNTDNYRRTRIYESIHLNSAEWPSFCTSQFSRLSRHRIVCGLYVSDEGDKGIGIHKDEWDGVIIQTNGSKNWTIYDDYSNKIEITLNAGDILFLPKNLNHDVSTNGHSEHLVFAFLSKKITPTTP